MTLDNLLQRVPYVPNKLVVDLDVVRGLQTAGFSELLTSRSQVSPRQVFLEFGVFPYVKEDDDVVVRVRVPLVISSGRVDSQLDVTCDDQVALDQLDPVHLDLSRLSKRLDLVRSQFRQAVLDPAQVFPQFLAQGGPVRGGLVLDPDLFFVRSQGDGKDVQLFLDVSFERLDVVEVFGVVVEDDDLLQGLRVATRKRSIIVSLPCHNEPSRTHLFDGQLFPIPQQPRQVDDGLHPLDLPLDDLVKVLFPDLGEHSEVHRTDVFVAVLRGRGKGQERVVEVFRGERRKGTEGERERVERLEQGVESRHGVLVTAVALQSVSVESDVPVGQLGDQVEQSGHDRVESVGCKSGRNNSFSNEIEV